MTKTFHTMDKAEWLKLAGLFHPQHGSHYIDLPNGRILLCADFVDEGTEEAFSLRATSLKSLPHPVFSGTEKISAYHVDELSHLFAGKEDSRKATVHDVVRKAAAIHPLMRLSVF